MLARFDRLVLVVGIVQRQIERLGKIDGKESGRQQSGRHVGIARLRGRAGVAFLGNCREAVVGGDDNIGRCGKAAA